MIYDYSPIWTHFLVEVRLRVSIYRGAKKITARKDAMGKKYYALYTLSMLALAAYMLLRGIRSSLEGGFILWLLTLIVITWTYPWGRVSQVLVGEQVLLLLGFLFLNPPAPSNIELMSYHHPVVFIGYALLTVPFAEALLGVSDRGKSYLYLGWLMLSTGLALGGLRAYRVLGGGGLWSWEPVAAASLVSWLLVTMGLHLYQRDQGRPFTILAHVSAIWATALMCSGNLAALPDLGSKIYLYLLLAGHLVVSFFALVKHRKQQDPLPLVWQATGLYALWVVVVTALPLAIRPIFYRSGAVPAVLLTVWALRHSLKRDGTGRSLAHFGVILLLLGIVVSGQYSSSQTLSLEGGDMHQQDVSTNPIMSLVGFGVALTLFGGLATFVEHGLSKRDLK